MSPFQIRYQFTYCMKYILYAFLACALFFAAKYLHSIEDWTRAVDIARNADEIQVYTVEKTDKHVSKKLLYTTKDAKDISEFADAMRVKKNVAVTHKGLIGLPLIKLSSKGQTILEISSHDYKKISATNCKLDGILKNPQKWRNWFEKRIPALKQ